ncbi:MAG: DUF2652 domain-containing protein [Proteobacteria bacterium]|nr:DUF2652 domain-containing protein [Pseudomonadota bacterium]
MATAATDTLLLIADISGYTRFLKFHRASLAHAQDIIAQLLEAVIDAVSPALKLAKLEGDAAFFHAPAPMDETTLARHAAAIHGAFHARRSDLALNAMCACDGCRQAVDLKIKVVGHVGTVAQRRIARSVELSGVDVIVVHRLLKNAVPRDEYLLVTEPLLPQLPAAERERATALAMDIADVGPLATWYVDLGALATAAPPPPRRRPLLARIGAQVRMSVRTLPYALGWRVPCRDFRNMTDVQRG